MFYSILFYVFVFTILAVSGYFLFRNIGQKPKPPVTQGPVTQGPVTQGPVTQGPVTQGPVTQGPVTQGPVTQGPVTQLPPLNNKDNTDNYQIRVWQTGTTDYTLNTYDSPFYKNYQSGSNVLFPEKLYMPKCNAKEILGVTISGGGTKSATFGGGMFRSLNKLNIMDKAAYVATSSGGGWFYIPYTFARGQGFTDEQILGKYTKPEQLTFDILENQNFDNPYYFGFPSVFVNIFQTTKGQNLTPIDIVIGLLTEYIPKYGSTYVSKNWFQISLGYFFLNAYGLFKDVPFALNKKHAEEINKNNGTNYDILTPKETDPFVLTHAGLLHKTTSELTGKTLLYPEYIPLTISPLYTGLLQTYKLEDGTEIGGYAIDTFAFGKCRPPMEKLKYIDYTNFQNKYKAMENEYPVKYNVSKIKKPSNSFFSLSDMIACPGIAWSSVVYSLLKISNIIPTTSSLNPTQYEIWKTKLVVPTTSDSQCYVKNIFNSECGANKGYDKESCEYRSLRCYSTTSPQCKQDSDCQYNLFNSECVSKNGQESDLNCILDPSKLKCVCNSIYNKSSYLNNPYLNLENVTLNDGDVTDTTCITDLVARGVTKIVCILGREFSIFANDKGDFFDPVVYGSCTIAPNLFFNLPFLFGANKYGSCIPIASAHSYAQIFYKEDYQGILEQFKRNFLAGGPVYAREKLRVKPNPYYGVKGDYQVDLMIITNYKSKRFEDSLPADIRNSINLDPLRWGFFPLLPSFFASPPKLFQLTKEQQNLLANYGSWVGEQPQIQNEILDMYKDL